MLFKILINKYKRLMKVVKPRINLSYLVIIRCVYSIIIGTFYMSIVVDGCLAPLIYYHIIGKTMSTYGEYFITGFYLAIPLGIVLFIFTLFCDKNFNILNKGCAAHSK